MTVYVVCVRATMEYVRVFRSFDEAEKFCQKTENGRSFSGFIPENYFIILGETLETK